MNNAVIDFAKRQLIRMLPRILHMVLIYTLSIVACVGVCVVAPWNPILLVYAAFVGLISLIAVVLAVSKYPMGTCALYLITVCQLAMCWMLALPDII